MSYINKMSKFTLFKSKILQLRATTCLFFIIYFIGIIQLISQPNAYNYRHLPAEVLETQLYRQTVPKLVMHKNKPHCKYDEVLKSSKSLQEWEIPTKFDDFSAKGIVNGSYCPEHCNPMFSVAIIVPYRNRQSQLDIFLPFMHNYLRKQNIHYRIYLIEQQDERPWNKGVLINVGAKQAIADKFPCLIIHDVDVLPLSVSHPYVCTAEPRHMSAAVDKFRYVLPYYKLVGGALAIKSDQFVAVNGFSNRFEWWGGEDDDFADRLNVHKYNIVRFPREMSRYTMLPHPQSPINPERERVMSENHHQRASDGLNTLPYYNIQIKNHRLFTLVGVHL